MNKFEKAGLLVFVLIFSFAVIVSAADTTEINVGSLKGPTTLGMLKMLSDSDEGQSALKINDTMTGTADEIVTGLVGGKLDAAAVPCNLAGVLYNKTKGGIQNAAINTLGVLYVVETGNKIQSVADLKGMTIYSTGKGTTPEFALNYILKQNGIDPEKDVTIEYKSEATEVAAMLADAAEGVAAVLPQPYVTAVQMQNDKVRVALSLTDEWNKVSKDSALLTGCLVVRKDFADANKDVFNTFLNEYKASAEWVNANVDQAADLAVKYEVVAKAPIAKKAIPACNITYIDGDEMKTKLNGYLSVLFAAEPKSVGGKMPADDFYYTK